MRHGAQKGSLSQFDWMRPTLRNVRRRLMKNLPRMWSLTGCPRPRTPGQISTIQGVTLMRFRQLLRAALFLPLILGLLSAKPANADGNLKKVKHVVVIMQETHSFDNYFGALAYAPGSPYHTSLFGCRNGDHSCVDGLTCVPDTDGGLRCYNANRDDDGSLVSAFHDSRRCAAPDLDHSWLGTHQEMNFLNPNGTRQFSLSDGFVRVNDKTEQVDNEIGRATS